MTDPTAARLVARLNLQPHPEGGYFRETWRDPGRVVDVIAGNAGGGVAAADRADGSGPGTRGSGTAILYLLAEGQRSHWHRVDATEIWHFYSGDPLRLLLWSGEGSTTTILLGPDLAGGQQPQAIVPAGVWQAAEPVGRYALCGCTVSPAFDFGGFEMAAAGWSPPPEPPVETHATAIRVDTSLPPPSRHLRQSGADVQWRWLASSATVQGTVRFGDAAEGLPGHVHGGLVSALCDEAMGWACWMQGYVAPGARVSVEFAAPLRAGDVADVCARLLVANGRKLLLSATVQGPRGPCATASGSYVAVDVRDLTPFAGWPGAERFAPSRVP